MSATATGASAATFFFNTGGPDGRLAALSRPGSTGAIETETADDFVLDHTTQLTSATFTGLLPSGAALTDIKNVVVEIYRVFPKDSTSPPSGSVPTRVNSPSDVAFDSRDAGSGDITFTPGLINPSFTAANSVVNGIHPSPGEFTGGEGAVAGEEVTFNILFSKPFFLGADHYFFVPQVELGHGNFLWLSAPKPIVAPGTPFAPDLQAWIRNENLAPDWLRIGTDITHQGPFNMAFSLVGATVPEPASWALMLAGFGLAGAALRTRRRIA
ncbi:PEPxxWA-CTERM sorting domain-containing protein [Phenylobacterium sp.]|uniref:PEPxxWA-CTERM sorting domain-containing protein n=1 Tax=Phenylobacterium sp. TaxID=1871053 RepID=UPI0025F92C99|nr:PEPxxWA-CTERM sorting domain-containing protein [Phenylobacterium sp.]